MYHPLAVHIHQPPGNTFELSGDFISDGWDQWWEYRPYKLKPIRIPMCLDKLGDIPIDHPF